MSAITRIAERLTARTWSADEIDAFLGPALGCAVTHAADESVRSAAASGGSVSTLLIGELASGRADAALVTRSVVVGGRVRARYELVSDAEGVLEARGSTYVLGDFVREGLPLIESHPGRVAVVCLPCEATALSRRPDLAEKVSLVITLFCGHASRPELVDAVVERLAPTPDAVLESFRFRSGHWRGQLTARFAGGEVVTKPFSVFGTPQNLYYASAKKCLFCGDHFGYNADVCAGDLWSARYAKDPIKHTALVMKTERGAAAVAAARESGALAAEDVGCEVVIDGQRRVAPFHHNVSARARAARRYDIRIPDPGLRVRWHEALAARIVLAGYKTTETEDGLRRALDRPSWYRKLVLYVLKGLESLS